MRDEGARRLELDVLAALDEILGTERPDQGGGHAVLSKVGNSDATVLRLAVTSPSGASTVVAKAFPKRSRWGRTADGELAYYRTVRCCPHTTRCFGVVSHGLCDVLVLEDLGDLATVEDALIGDPTLTTAAAEDAVDHIVKCVHGTTLGASTAARWAHFTSEILERTTVRLSWLVASQCPQAIATLAREGLARTAEVANMRSRLGPLLPDLVAQTHGDPHLGNYLCGRTAWSIDPHPNGVRSSLYDLAKLAQSFGPGYALATRRNPSQAEVARSSALGLRMAEILRNALGRGDDLVHVVEVTAGLHLLAAAPHHIDDPKETTAMLEAGLQRIAVATNSFGSAGVRT